MDKKSISVVEFNKYRKDVDKVLNELTFKVAKQERQLSMTYSIMSISKYINDFMLSEHFLDRINITILSTLDTDNSSIYIYNQRVLKLACTSLSNTDHHKAIIEKLGSTITQYIYNSEEPISSICNSRSIIGVPIKFKKKLLGYILVESNSSYALSGEIVDYANLIASQLSIGIDNSRLYSEVRSRADKDGMTMLYNRSYFFNTLKEIKGEVYCIIMLDIDDFKKCNDTYGHQFGDRVLIEVSRLLLNNTRKDDIVARYGGEEIIIYLYGIRDVSTAFSKADSLRKIVERHKIVDEKYSSSVTVSVGVCINKSKTSTLENSIAEADKMMYKSKKNGKNMTNISQT